MPELNQVLHDPKRLAALFRIGLLDSPPEEPFDRLTALATRVLGVPVSLVSLVDDHRQFFKSASGLPDPWASRRETALSHSFCQHVVASGEPLVVEDARMHPLLCDNLAVQDLNVVAYLGIPLKTPEGQTVGSFCAIDTGRRIWSQFDQETMRELAASVMSEVALSIANRSMEEQVRVRTAELSATNLALHEIEARYLSLVDRSPQGVVVHRRHRIVNANGALAKMWGYAHPDELIGRHLAEVLFAPEDRAAEAHRQAALYASGSMPPASAEFRGVRKDGREIWFANSDTLIVWQGQPAVLSFCVDITERKRSEKRQRRMIAELDHRVKNVLARVSAVVNFTRSGATSIEGFVATLDGRVQSLASAHQLLSSSSWQGASLAQVVAGQLAINDALERTAFDGPGVLLTTDATEALAPVFHELVTNAVKYGALKTALGRVALSWQIVQASVGGPPGRQLVIEWQETGGPAVEPPKRSGFGTRMIREQIKHELMGVTDLVFEPAGVRCRMTIPLAKVAVAA